jgi:uncharacterized membrane protein YkoI
MKKVSWFWVVICSFLIIIVFISWQQFGKLRPSADILTEQDAQKLVQERYHGRVSLIKLTSQQYHIELEKQNQLYIITLEAESGKVLSFTKSETITSTPTPVPTPTPEPSPTAINEPPKRLTEPEAVKIAITQVQGDVDDIWLETENNQTYYFVKIETNDDREAIVQIHAITGEVMSVTWDDHKDRNKENKEDDD